MGDTVVPTWSDFGRNVLGRVPTSGRALQHMSETLYSTTRALANAAKPAYNSAATQLNKKVTNLRRGPEGCVGSLSAGGGEAPSSLKSQAAKWLGYEEDPVSCQYGMMSEAARDYIKSLEHILAREGKHHVLSLDDISTKCGTDLTPWDTAGVRQTCKSGGACAAFCETHWYPPCTNHWEELMETDYTKLYEDLEAENTREEQETFDLSDDDEMLSVNGQDPISSNSPRQKSSHTVTERLESQSPREGTYSSFLGQSL